MRNKKKLIIVALQIILSIMFVMGYKGYVEFELQPVYVYGYATDLMAGTKITQRDLIQISVSQTTLNANMITEERINDVIGKYTKMDVLGNSIIYQGQLSETSGVDKFSSLDLSNSRVITLEASALSSAHGEFERGDTIDLIYTASASASSSSGESYSFTYSKIFMQNVTVYQVNTPGGYVFTPHMHYKSNQIITLEDGTQTYPNFEPIGSVSIIVTPEQAEEIYVRRNTGTIEIVKRFDESETHETLGFVMGEYGKIFVGNASTETGHISISNSMLVQNKDAEEETPPTLNAASSVSGVE